MATLIVIMGVAGSGKTVVAEALAAALDWPCYDADHYHSPDNIEKMSRGQPLSDEDREAWLEALAVVLREHAANRESAVLACSALKQRYRDQLHVDDSVHFVYLQGDFDLIMARLNGRTGHYMKPDMLASQFAALEPPQDALVIDIRAPVDEIVAEIWQRMGLRP